MAWSLNPRLESGSGLSLDRPYSWKFRRSAARTHVNIGCCSLLSKDRPFHPQTFSQALSCVLWEMRKFFAPGSFLSAGGGKTHGNGAECGKNFKWSYKSLEERRDGLWMAASQALLWSWIRKNNIICVISRETQKEASTDKSWMWPWSRRLLIQFMETKQNIDKGKEVMKGRCT